MDRKYLHIGGRECTYDVGGRSWSYKDDEGVLWPCLSSHDGQPQQSVITTLGDREQQFLMTVTTDGISVRYGDSGFDTKVETEEARIILRDVLPALLSMFLTKNAQYARAQTGHDLGIKGIIPDINRKSAAIISRVWDADNYRDKETQDSTEELAGDLIGHLLLMLAKMKMMDDA